FRSALGGPALIRKRHTGPTTAAAGLAASISTLRHARVHPPAQAVRRSVKSVLHRAVRLMVGQGIPTPTSAAPLRGLRAPRPGVAGLRARGGDAEGEGRAPTIGPVDG